MRLPKDYHAALIAYIKNELTKYPEGYLYDGNERRIIVNCRTGDPSVLGRHKFQAGSKKGRYYAELLRIKEDLARQLHELEHQWYAEYKESPVTDVPVYNGPMDTAYYENAKPCGNAYEIKHPNPCSGITFRSKNEMLAAKTLEEMGLEYKYETLFSANKKLYPDFLVLAKALNRCFYVEIVGALDLKEYALNAGEKVGHYLMAGLKPGRDIIFYIAPNAFEFDAEVFNEQVVTALELASRPASSSILTTLRLNSYFKTR